MAELIEELITTDLSGRTPGGTGDLVELAVRRDGTPVTFPPYACNILVSGPSGAGKSTFATGLIERLIDRNYQLCIIDPEGDYSTLDEIVTVGSRVRAPHVGEILERLSDPEAQVVVNLLGMPLRERPDFFSQLFPRLQALRARTGRPHWLLIDEVHHLLPAQWGLAPSTLPQRLGETILITYRPREVSASILAMVDTAVAVGPSPEATLAELATALGTAPPQTPAGEIKRDEVVVWQRTRRWRPVHRGHDSAPAPSACGISGNMRRAISDPQSFFFRGPGARMNLRAQNLTSFCEMAAGVDDDTWLFHLRRGDYSAWMRGAIKDEDLAREVVAVEDAAHLDSDREPAHGLRRDRQALHASTVKCRVVARPSAAGVARHL